MRIVIILFIAFVLLGIVSIPYAEAQKSSVSKIQIIKAHSRLYSIEFTLRKTVIPDEKIANQYWGSYARQGFPRSEWKAISKIRYLPVNLKIFYKSKSIFVPYSCYSDLADINRIHIKPKTHGCQVLIDGGDASLGYYSKLTITEDQVVKRSVRTAEMEDTYEVTNYH